MLAGLRLAVSGTDVASISWSLGEHYFTEAQVAEMHSILLGAAAHHDLGFVDPLIYRIARSSSYSQAFHDITTGNNSVTAGQAVVAGYQAGPGWDPVTGWGSPSAQVLIPLLTRSQT